MENLSWGLLIVGFLMGMMSGAIPVLAVIGGCCIGGVVLIQIFPYLVQMQKERNRALEEKARSDIKMLNTTLK